MNVALGATIFLDLELALDLVFGFWRERCSFTQEQRCTCHENLSRFS